MLQEYRLSTQCLFGDSGLKIIIEPTIRRETHDVCAYQIPCTKQQQIVAKGAILHSFTQSLYSLSIRGMLINYIVTLDLRMLLPHVPEEMIAIVPGIRPPFADEPHLSVSIEQTAKGRQHRSLDDFAPKVQ